MILSELSLAETMVFFVCFVNLIQVHLYKSKVVYCFEEKMMSILSYVALTYFVLGFLCWNLVLFVARRDASVSFALKSGILLLLFWPPFIYRATKKIFVDNSNESSL